MQSRLSALDRIARTNLDGRRGSYLVVPRTKTVHVGMVVMGRCTCSSTSRKTSHSEESRWDNCAAVLTWGLHIHGGTQSGPRDALVWSGRLILGRTSRRSPFETLHLKRDQDPQLLCSCSREAGCSSLRRLLSARVRRTSCATSVMQLTLRSCSSWKRPAFAIRRWVAPLGPRELLHLLPTAFCRSLSCFK